MIVEVETVEEPASVSHPQPSYSAAVVSSAPLVLGVEASEDGSCRGDVTKEFEDTLLNAGANQAYRCGRIILPTASNGVIVPAEVKLIIANDGNIAWPETTAVCIVAGDAFGLPSMPLGPLQSGEAAEIILDLNVPVKSEPSLARSVWSMIDAATGSAFGPLLILEVVWAVA